MAAPPRTVPPHELSCLSACTRTSSCGAVCLQVERWHALPAPQAAATCRLRLHPRTNRTDTITASLAARTRRFLVATTLTWAVLALASMTAVLAQLSFLSDTDSGIFDNSIRQYMAATRLGVVSTTDLDDNWTVLQTFYSTGITAAYNVDDYPFFNVAPAFLVPFGGRSYSQLYVNPNGAIHFSSTLLCCAYLADLVTQKCFQTSTCNLNTTYTNVIAPFLVDLNPGKSSDASISYASSTSVLKIRWMDVPFYSSESSQTVSFQVNLYPHGGIDMQFFEVHDPPSSDISPDWIAGALRYDASTNDDLLGASSYQESSERLVYATQQASWGTTVRGAYPFQSEDSIPASSTAIAFQSGMGILYCPVSANWCLSPSVGSTNASQVVALVSSDLTCFQSPYQHSTQCRFYPCTVSGSAACTPSTSFLSSTASFDSVTGALSCSTPAMSLFDATPVDSKVEVRLFDVTSSLEVGFLRPLYFQYLSPDDATAFFNALPTLASLGNYTNYTQDIRLLQLGVYPLLCDDCSAVASPFCALDCAGVFAGQALIDGCGICAGGTAAQPIFNGDMDCSGHCFTLVAESLIASTPAYCACNNDNVTIAGIALTNYDTAIPTFIKEMLREFSCPHEDLHDVTDTLLPLSSYYQFALLLLTGLGFLFVPTKFAFDWWWERQEEHDDDPTEMDIPASPALLGPAPSPEPQPATASSSSAPSLRHTSHRRTPPSISPRHARGPSGHHSHSASSSLATGSGGGGGGSSSSASSPFVILPMAGVGAAIVLADGETARRPSIAGRVADARTRSQSHHPAHSHDFGTSAAASSSYSPRYHS